MKKQLKQNKNNKITGYSPNGMVPPYMQQGGFMGMSNTGQPLWLGPNVSHPVSHNPAAQSGNMAYGGIIGASAMGQAPPYMKNGGNWIQGAVNPAHKGFCSPMTKSTCTPRRKAFAKNMKKHHGFHKEYGGEIPEYLPGEPWDTNPQVDPSVISGYNQTMQNSGYQPFTTNTTGQPMITPLYANAQEMMVPDAPMTTSNNVQKRKRLHPATDWNNTFNNLLDSEAALGSYLNTMNNAQSVHQQSQQMGLTGAGGWSMNQPGSKGDYSQQGYFRPQQNTPTAAGMFYPIMGKYGGKMCKTGDPMKMPMGGMFDMNIPVNIVNQDRYHNYIPTENWLNPPVMNNLSTGWEGFGQDENLIKPQGNPAEYSDVKGYQPTRGNLNMDIGDYSIDKVREQNQYAYGGQTPAGVNGFSRGLSTPWYGSPSAQQGLPDEYKTDRVLPESDNPDIEAEKNEQILGNFSGDGTPALMDVSGPPHSEGGKGVNVPDGSFVFSDTKDLKIKDKEILKEFNMPTKGKRGYTPASIAKQYDIQKYATKLQDPDTDPITRKTAEMMTKNYLQKLDKLSKIQEGMKQQMGIDQPEQHMRYGGIPMAKNGFRFDQENPYNNNNFQYYGQDEPFTVTAKKPDKVAGDIAPYAQLPTGQGTISPVTMQPPPLPNNLQANTQEETSVNSTLGNIQNTPQKQSRQFTRPDQLGMLNSALNYAGLHKYLPWEPPVTEVLPQTVFMDPTRALAANSEQANMAYRGAGNSRSGNTANFLAIQGQAGKQAADIIGQTQGQNVQIANQANVQAAQITNGILELQRNRLKSLHQGNTVAAQQYDNAERETRADLLNVYTNGWKNRQGYNDLNQTNQFYKRDPKTGFMVFNSEQTKANFEKMFNGTQNYSPDIAEKVQKYYQELLKQPVYQSDHGQIEALKLAQRMAGAGESQSTESTGTGVVKRVREKGIYSGPKQNRYGGPFSHLKDFVK